jgi:hypothetical protein
MLPTVRKVAARPADPDVVVEPGFVVDAGSRDWRCESSRDHGCLGFADVLAIAGPCRGAGLTCSSCFSGFRDPLFAK